MKDFAFWKKFDLFVSRNENEGRTAFDFTVNCSFDHLSHMQLLKQNYEFIAEKLDKGEFKIYMKKKS